MRKRARSAVDREQVIHERHDALKARVGRLGFGLHRYGTDEAARGLRKAVGVDQIFGSDIFFIHDVSIGVEDSTIVLEELLGDLLASRHLEVEDHSLTRRAELPEKGAMVLPLLFRCLHVYVRLVGLYVASGEQVALRRVDQRDQQLAYT